jgi:hypothetical protein
MAITGPEGRSGSAKRVPFVVAAEVTPSRG